MYRNEYPRPNFMRDRWLCLNGEWDFRFDNEAWRKINVPFAFQSKLSGIHENRLCSTVWYRRRFTVPEEWKGNLIVMNFGAVDYKCRVSINGQTVGEHIGGNTSFSFDITEYLNWSEEEIVVYVEDPWDDETIPRGKQSWLEKSKSIWYTRTTGIWQSVWIEPINRIHLEYIRFTPDIDGGNIGIEFEVSGLDKGLSVELQINCKGESAAHVTMNIQDKYNKISVNLFNRKIFRTATHHSGWCWTPETPNLFDVKARLFKGSACVDEVDSYFGMRKIHTDNGIVYLNNRPYYQKLVLDQGYWPDGLMTAPSDESFKIDIEMAKKMGFNGCRKHQKIEDPRFAYWADRLGFLVWCEMPSCAEFSHKSVERTTREWIDVIDRNYNHPSIVAWVPLNESWGVPRISSDRKEQNHSLAMYHLTHSLDDTRLVISNDGWELTKTDICAVHNYNHGNKGELEKFKYFEESLSDKGNILASQPSGRKIYADGFKHEGEPVMLTEFGGIAFSMSDSPGWGYSVVSDEKEFLEEYGHLIDAVYNSGIIYGFCYTQLTDVEQEVNGLLTYDRKPKCQLEKIKEINARYRNNIITDK